MNVMITVSGKRKSGRSTLLNWLETKLTDMGANVVIDMEQHTMLLTADKGFLAPVPQQMRGESASVISEDILSKANHIINGDREQTYGDAGKNLRVIAEYWSTHLNATYGQKAALTPTDVCVMMMLLKQARLANNPEHYDSLLDIAGYAGLLDKVNKQAQKSEEQAVGNSTL